MEKELYKQLSEPMPAESIQRTKKSETRKGYDTVGCGYQYCVNRFNEVLGLQGWGFEWQIIKEEAGQYKSGQGFWDITVSVSIWIGVNKEKRTCVGGHISTSYADA